MFMQQLMSETRVTYIEEVGGERCKEPGNFIVSEDGD
jgi:hypothetical protein